MLLARDLITDTVPSVKTSDSAARVLEWMGEFKVNQLPVVNHERLLGIIGEQDLLEADLDDESPVGALRLSLPEQTYVHEDSHFYDVLKMASIMKLDVLPVLSARDNTYLGAITKHDLVTRSAEFLNVEEPGGVIVLAVGLNSYSISEIGRICESNDAKIMSLSVSNAPELGKLHVTLKLNIRELSRVISTFERFEYEIVLVVFDAEQLNDFKERYENLLRYLNL